MKSLLVLAGALVLLAVGAVAAFLIVTSGLEEAAKGLDNCPEGTKDDILCDAP